MFRTFLFAACAALALTAAPARAYDSYASPLEEQDRSNMQYEIDQTKINQELIETEQWRQRREIEKLQNGYR
jgi:hypothetical protein